MSQLACVVAPEGSSDWVLRGGVCTLCDTKCSKLSSGSVPNTPVTCRMAKEAKTTTLGGLLAARLVEIGVTHVFGVPGASGARWHRIQYTQQRHLLQERSAHCLGRDALLLILTA
jgi:hypothetical protein